MYLIDKPFVSDFLIQTIRDNNYEIIATHTAKEMLTDYSLNWISEEEALEKINRDPQTAIYSNSENALNWIEQNLRECELSYQIKVLKDKVKFRELVKHIFPDFYYEKISLADIQNFSIKDCSFPFVIKPSVGFLSIGVYIVKNEKDWETAKNELNSKNLRSIFPEHVLNTNYFIIEEFVFGEEYAVDYYYNKNGEAIVLNIMHHIFSSNTDTSDRVYSTSKEIIHRHKTDIENFLNEIGQQLKLRNFPAHAEVRIDDKGKIVPIEINPLRFGGWCTTADLLGLTLGFNSYKYFFENKEPAWEKIFRNKEDKIFSIVVLDNNSGISPVNIKNFDYLKLSGDFENPVLLRKFDIKKYPVFGFVFLETSPQNVKELNEILTSDLRKYITTA